MQQTVIIEDSKNNIYLVFNKIDESLVHHLNEYSGFMPTTNPKKWWAKNHPAYFNFAKELQNAIQTNTPITEVYLLPSYESTYENLQGIDTNGKNTRNPKFSTVSILLNRNDKQVTDHYLIFENFGKAAKIIATRFAKQAYGDDFISLEAYPKKPIKKARQLWEEKKIIDESSFEKQKTVERLETKKEYEEIDIPLEGDLRIKILVQKVEENYFQWGLDLHLTIGLERKVFFEPLEDEKYYKSREKAIAAALGDVLMKITSWKERSSMFSENQEEDDRLFLKLFEDVKKFAQAKKIEPDFEDIHGLSISSEKKESQAEGKERASLTNEHQVYTQKSAKENYEEIALPLPENAGFDLIIKIVKDEQELYRTGISVDKKFGDHSSYSSPVSKTSKVFITKAEAIHSSLKEIHGYLEQQSKQRDSILSNEETKNKKVKLAIEGLNKFAKQEKQESFLQELNQGSASISVLTKQGFTPQSLLEQFDQHYRESKFIDAAHSLYPFLEDLGNGLYLEYLPQIIERFGLPKMKKALSDLGYDSLARVLNSQGFQDQLSHNLWELIPERLKQVKPIKKLIWKPEPNDKNLQSILSPFVGNKTFYEYELGAYFDEKGIIATDRVKMIFLSTPSKNVRGTYCITTKCKKNFIDGYDLIYGAEKINEQEFQKYQGNNTFPHYEKAIPVSTEIINEIDLKKLKVFLTAYHKSNLWKDQVFLQFKEGFAAYDPQRLLSCVGSFLKLGYTELGVYSQGSRNTLLLIPKGQESKVSSLTTDFIILMPVDPNSDFYQSQKDDWIKKMQKGMIYYDLKSQRVKTAGIEDTVKEKVSAEPKKNSYQEYLELVIAEMHGHYSKGQRLSKGKIKQLGQKLEIPTEGMLWEMVETSWLLWYKQINKELLPFENRLAKMIQFWNEVQPTYDYADSGKIEYQQYSTPCPIGAIIGYYTKMESSPNTLDPSAGNGLLVMSANPKFTDVNEIDPSRIESLKFQQFRKVTTHNASWPFPEEQEKKYDVVVTNPPFASWGDEKFDKKYYVQKYFNNYRGLAQNMRMEHAMCGFALQTMKDTGKAAIIIMGHINYDKNGLFKRYRSFFNWLYAHYHVDDVINMNGFNLYSKQGTVVRTMMLLINGRKKKPFGVAPLASEFPHLTTQVNTFMELYQRVNSHRKKDPLTLIKQLKKAQ